MMIVRPYFIQRVFIAVFAIGALFAIAEPAPAAVQSKDLPYRKGFKVGIGNIALHAALKTELEYDSNIFLTPSNRRGDLITLLNPSAGIEIPFLNHMLSAEYDAGFEQFSEHHEQDHIDHRFRGMLEFNFNESKFFVDEVYRRFTGRAGSESTARIRQQTNDVGATFSSQRELLGWSLGYRNRIQDYLSKEFAFGPLTYEDKSTVTNIMTGELSYRIMPKTLLVIQSDLGFVDYYNSSLSPDSWYTEDLAGIRGEWFKRVNVDLKAGVRYQSYNDTDKIIVGHKDYIGPVIHGGFEYFATEDDTVSVRLERSIYESTYSGVNYYNVNLIGFDYDHRFNDKVSAGAFASYQLNLYPSQTIENGVTAKRYDNLFGGGLRLRYDIRKWMSTEARYEYRERVSRFSNLDYYDNLITLRGTVGL